MSTGLRLSTTAVVALISAATARRPAPTSSPPSTDILSDNPGELLKPPDGVSFDDRLTRRPAPQPPVKDWCRSAVYTRSCRWCMVVQHRRSVLMRATCDTRGTRIEHCVHFLGHARPPSAPSPIPSGAGCRLSSSLLERERPSDQLLQQAARMGKRLRPGRSPRRFRRLDGY